MKHVGACKQKRQAVRASEDRGMSRVYWAVRGVLLLRALCSDTFSPSGFQIAVTNSNEVESLHRASSVTIHAHRQYQNHVLHRQRR